MSKKPSESPLSMRDREELLEMVTNIKLIALKLRTFHNRNVFHDRSPEYANQAIRLEKVSQILSMIEKEHGK